MKSKSTIVLLLALAALPRPAEAQPGYKGTLPSTAGRRALDAIHEHGEFDGIPLFFGGSVFEVERMVVTLQPLGPGRADVLELGSVRTKGPHVVLRRGKLGIFVPTRCDADVRALHELLGLEAPDGLDEGEPSAEFGQAIAAVRGLGPAVDGVRVGLSRLEPGDGTLRFELTIWNTGDEAIEWTGHASLHTDGRREPFGFQPPRLQPPEGGFRLRLGPASSMTVPIEIPARVEREAAAAGDDGPRIPKGDRRAVAELRVLRGDREPLVVSSAELAAETPR